MLNKSTDFGIFPSENVHSACTALFDLPMLACQRCRLASTGPDHPTQTTRVSALPSVFVEEGLGACARDGRDAAAVQLHWHHYAALEFDSYLWFGSPPGQPLPDIRVMKTATHTKANAAGVKLERSSQRDIPRSAFTPLGSLDAVLEHLFGSVP
ncbi:hypothetical protein [Paraburkholderia sediminicola]|uniref:hypothetical protein n=1 Tax=Paraburkholderia sediminicola TaxID=458836 RepID=UPI0038BD79BA